MSQQVRSDMTNLCLMAILYNQFPESLSADPCPAFIDKEERRSFALEPSRAHVQVAANPADGALSQRDRALFASLPQGCQKTHIEIHIGGLDRHQLGYAQARGV